MHPFFKALTINTKSPAYRRARMAGFKIFNLQVAEDPAFGIILRVNFQCVCGRPEAFQLTLGNIDRRNAEYFSEDYRFRDGWDVALELERLGSFSAEHLHNDGYSEEAIKEIRYIYDLEDEVAELRRMKLIFESTHGNYYDDAWKRKA